MCKRLMVLTAAVMLAGAPALAQVTYTSQTRQVAYEVEVGDMYSTDLYQNSVSAPDFEPFDTELYLNIEWPSKVWVDVEGRANVSQSSSLTSTLLTAAGVSHVHAFVEEDQTQAFADALGDSSFYVEFDLANPLTVSLTGDTTWVRSPSDPPQEVSLYITLHRAGVPVFTHVREYIRSSGVTQDDGDTLAFAGTLPAGSYALEIIAYTEAFSQGPWRQYAEATATYDVTMTVSVHGDLDGDNDVDLADLAQLLANYGTTTGMTHADGDLDADGDVDLSDLASLLAVYGTTT